MAATVPDSLKLADITRFAIRAAQVEKAKPAVAYWCHYWIVQQIVMKGLHNVDDESKAYTGGLMDKLEQAKTEHPNEDAITDDIAAKAYLEQFGLEIFQRADNAIRANKASRQTADTFQAAYTFLELLQVWPPLDGEITAKIKFAKYHALRIAKALKAGEDPNLSNPTPEQTPAQETAPLDPTDPEVQALGGLAPSIDGPSRLHQPSIEDVPDEHDKMSAALARTSTIDQSLHPSRAPSVPPGPSAGPAPPPTLNTSAESFYQGTDQPDVSPLEPMSAGKAPSVGGGYFPKIPGEGGAQAPHLPQAPDFAPGKAADAPDVSPLQPPTQSPFSQAPQPPLPPPSLAIGGLPQSHLPHVPPPTQDHVIPPSSAYQVPYPQQPPQQTQPQQPPQQTQSFHPPLVSVAPAHVMSQQTEYIPDEAAIAKAQKHARWAISALNFEDVKTAMAELQGALDTLGGR